MPNAPRSAINLTTTVLFDVLSFAGVISLSLILWTVWRFRVYRTATWSLCITSWALYSFGHLLIIGRQTVGSVPNFALCLSQATIIYADPVLAAAASTAFLSQVYLDIKYSLRGESVPRSYIATMLVASISGWASMLVLTLVSGLNNPNTVEREKNGLICHISHPLPHYVSGAIVLVLLIISVLVNVAIALTFLRNRTKWPNATRSYSASLLPRIILLDTAQFIALMLGIYEVIPHIGPHDTGMVCVIMASLPAVAGTIFGLQTDLLQIWKRLLFSRTKPVMLVMNNV